MRTLEFMLENWEKIQYEDKCKAKHEKYYRASKKCKYNHPPIRNVKNGECTICRIERNKKHNMFNRIIRAEKREKKEIEYRILHINECETLEKIKSGILYLVKGRCAA